MSNSHKDNWRELAEMLGLSVDEPGPAPAAPAPPAPAAKLAGPTPAPVQHSDDYSADFSEQAAHSVLQPEEREQFAAEFEDVVVEESTVDESIVDEPEGDESIADAQAPAAGSPESEQAAEERRGRRRGRRGKRRGRGEPEAGPEDAPPMPGKPDDLGEDEPRRGRRPQAVRADEAGSTRDESAPAAVADEDQDDDFSQDAWADWNVPNWQELIDGLYRPDR